MAIILLDSCKYQAGTDFARRWSLVTGTPAVSTTGGRDGGRCASMTQSWFRKNFASSRTAVITSGAFQFNDNGTGALFMILRDASASDRGVVGLQWASDNTLKIVQVDNANAVLGFGAPALTLGNWYYIEWLMTIGSSIAANSCILKINQAIGINLAAATDTRLFGSTSVTGVQVGSFSGAINSYNVKMQDIVILDTLGGVDDTFWGDVTIGVFKPNGSADYTTWSLTGAASKAAAVNEVPEDGDTGYITDRTPGDRESFTLGDFTETPLNIKAVQLVTTARKSGAGVRTIAPFTTISGVNYDNDSQAQSLSTDYVTNAVVLRENPATVSAWTESDVNALKIGTKVVS